MAIPRSDVERARFQEVQVNTLRLDSTLPFRLFTRLEGEHLLYRREGLPFSGMQRSALLDNGIERLFVHPAEVEVYWEYIRSSIRSLLTDEGGSLEERMACFYESSTQVTRQLMVSPIGDDALATARTLVTETVRFQDGGKQALHALMAKMKTDPDIYSHGLNVCQYGLAIARSYSFTHEEVEALGTGLLFLDLGMLQVPDSLLYKNGPLSFEEWELVKRHPAAGIELLAEVPGGVSELTRAVIFNHHERLNGSGYPQGLIGDEVPLAVRIAAIADVFDSLTTTRSYRLAYSTFEALERMNTEMQGEFDNDVLQRFITLLGR